MAQYFDRDFWKFLGAFAVIISISLVIIVATRLYQEQLVADSFSNQASVINSENQ